MSLRCGCHCLKCCPCIKFTLAELQKFKLDMTRVTINGKTLSEMSFKEAYPEVIRLLMEERFPTIK